MSMRYQAGIVLPGYNALKVANAPTIGTATQASCTSISVTFTAPSCVGGGAISSYTVFANCGVKTASGASSPLTVTGLSAGVPYTFKTIATNAYGPSYPSAASNSVTIPIITCATYTTAGTYSWVAPTGVTSVAVLAIGGGGGGGYNGSGGGNAGGGGGGLGYVNNYSVTPGNSYTVRVGAAGPASSSGFPGDGGQSYFVSTAVVKGCGGSGGYCTGGAPPGGNYVGTGGGNGGAGGRGTCGGGGGGAGGYAGNGGAGGGPTAQQTGGTGSGGGGGGGSSGGPKSGAGGGGVGLYGQGSNGAGGSYSGGVSGGGAGGSSGTNGQNWSSCSGSGSGGVYGGGAGGTWASGSGTGGTGGKGAVRIVWCSGGARGTPSFPSTNVGP